MRFVLALVVILCANAALASGPETTVRFGLTAVVVTDNMRLLDRWAIYLSGKLGQPVEFVRRRSYRQVMDLLRAGEVDMAWICGYPFVQPRDPEFLELLAVPVYRTRPLYHSYIIVHEDSPYQDFGDLRGSVFAFSDPDSNSGFLYPQALLIDRDERPESFFRQTFFTFNHAETVEAVAARVADGGAVDSYVWEYLAKLRPDMVGRTRVIHRSPVFGFPPLVARIGLDPDVTRRLAEILRGMEDDPEGRALLAGFDLDRFGHYSPDLFDDIRSMAQRVGAALPLLGAVERSR